MNGHKQKMSVSAMRDTITPLNNDGALFVNLQDYGQTIKELRYEAYSLDGSVILAEGNVKAMEEQMEIAL